MYRDGRRGGGRYGEITMLKKIAQSAAALMLVLGIVAATVQPAEAHRRGGGVAAGLAIGTILGLGIAGAYAGPRYYDHGPGCYRGPQAVRLRRSQLLVQQLRRAHLPRW